MDAAARATAAEEAVRARHLRRLFGLPGTALGVVSWPPRRRDRWWIEWHYWWQAHLVDCLVDAELRAPRAERRHTITAVLRSHRLRNLTGWTNRYYDDMSWLALALQRADGVTRTDWRGPLATLGRRVRAGWTSRGLPWRVGSDFYNAPANGPAAILMARTGRPALATATADWLHTVLRDPRTGLIRDGIHADGTMAETIYSYCQGVTLGLEVELARAGAGPDRTRHIGRAAALVAAIDEHLCHDGVLTGGSNGDGGLFNGILSRYLALTATDLPGDQTPARTARATAAAIVESSARACWHHRARTPHGPLFGHRWDLAAPLPSSDPDVAERDLSVQLSGWMLLEAAAALH